MAALLRAAALTAVVAIAVLAGLQLSNLVPDVGVPSPSPSPSPSANAPSPSASPTSTLPTGCINPPVDITTLIDMQSTGPLDPGVDPVACYGNAPLTFDATWYGGGVADCPNAPEPAWLACSSFSLQAAGDTRKLGAPQLFVAIDPSADVSSISDPMMQVRVTGHFDDPAAQTCRETQLVGDATSLAPAAEMIERCRRTFVVTEVVSLDLGVPSVLGPNAFAHVVAASVNVRSEPRLDAPTVSIAQGGETAPLQVVLGTSGGSEHVYILEGPVSADGFEWFRVAVIEYETIRTLGPPAIGWMADGDGVDPWLVVENPCPTATVSLADLTYTATNWAIRLGCFRGQELTLRGWYLVLATGFEGPCPSEPAFLTCGSGLYDVRPIEMSYYDERSANRLEFAVDPASGIVMPSAEQWIEITGHFDDAASAQCATDTDLGTLACRIQFVITGVTALGATAT